MIVSPGSPGKVTYKSPSLTIEIQLSKTCDLWVNCFVI